MNAQYAVEQLLDMLDKSGSAYLQTASILARSEFAALEAENERLKDVERTNQLFHEANLQLLKEKEELARTHQYLAISNKDLFYENEQLKESLDWTWKSWKEAWKDREVGISALYDQINTHFIDCPACTDNGKCTCESSQAAKELEKLLLKIERLEKAVDMADYIIKKIEPKYFSIRYWLKEYGKE